MEPVRSRLWPRAMGLGKAVVLAGILAAMLGAAPPRADERAWTARLRGGEPTAADAGRGPRADWAARPDTPLGRLRLLEIDDPEAAAAGYRERLRAAEAAGDSAAVLVCAERLAKLAVDGGRVPEARALLDRTLPLTASVGGPVAACRAHLDLGRALVRTRDMDGAADHLEQARAAAVALAIPRWQGDAALALSVVHRLRMDLDAALALRREAYDAYTAAGWTPGRARALHFIGTTHAMRGELTTALLRLREAEALAREAESDDILSGCLGDQAGIFYLTGEFDRALAQYAEASDLTSDPRRRGWYLSNMASILTYRQKHAEAVPRYEQALELVRASGDRRTEASMLTSLGHSLCALGDLDRGLRELDGAVAAAREFELPLEEANALQTKGHALIDAGRLDEARPLLEEALAIAGPLDAYEVFESTSLGLARIDRRQGRPADAVAHLRAAMEQVLRVRRLSGGAAGIQSGYFSQTNRSFDALVAALHDLHEREPGAGHDHEAWRVAQLGRARSLQDLLAETEVDLRVRADVGFQEREGRILDGLASLEERRAAAPDSAAVLDAEIRRLEAELDVLEAELRAADPRYAELRYPQPVPLDDARRDVLRPGEAVLEYQLGEEQSHLWLITRDRFVFCRLPPRAELEPLVRDLLPLLRDPSLTGDAAAWFTGPARAAAAALLDPVRDDLNGVRRLIVVPDDVLHYLPFGALPVRDTDAATFPEVPWLARQVEVTTTPSLSALARLRAVPEAGPDAPPLLLIADPTLPDPDQASVFVRAAGAAGLHPVPGAAAEQKRLVDLYGRRCRWFAGPEATPDKLRTVPTGGGPWRSIHLTTHGLVNEERPQYSGLVLAPSDDDDGFLGLAEIFALDLDCDQVVLSACSTALGEQVDGEGLIGLTRAFLYAGARSVVAALWDVDGDGAARFMGDYYARLAGGEPSRAGALAAVQRELGADPGRTSGGVPLAHPAVWAAFTGVGDCR